MVDGQRVLVDAVTVAEPRKVIDSVHFLGPGCNGNFTGAGRLLGCL